MLQITSARPAIGPHARSNTRPMRPLDKPGLSDVEMDATLTLVLTHVEGCAGARLPFTHPKRPV